MANEYKVLSIDEMVKPGEVGGIERFYRHKIKTKGGVILTVDVSEANFTAEKAAPILLKRAKEADAILSL